jgi:hypothetical protein
MIYFCILTYRSTHIIALMLVTLFVLKGSAPFFPLFYYDTLKTYPAALLTDSETDNQGKQCHEGHNEKEFMADHRNAAVTAILLIAAVKNSKHTTFYRPTHFFPVTTPPPNLLSFIRHFPQYHG